MPVFYPDVTHILGKPVFRKVADVPGGAVRAGQARVQRHASAASAAASAARRQASACMRPARAGPVDIVDVFRKPSDVLGHVDDILAARPKAVWLQSGITCPEAEEAFARAGIQVRGCCSSGRAGARCCTHAARHTPRAMPLRSTRWCRTRA